MIPTYQQQKTHLFGDSSQLRSSPGPTMAAGTYWCFSKGKLNQREMFRRSLQQCWGIWEWGAASRLWPRSQSHAEDDVEVGTKLWLGGRGFAVAEDTLVFAFCLAAPAMPALVLGSIPALGNPTGSTVALFSPWVVESFPSTLCLSLLLMVLQQVHPGGTTVGAEAMSHKLPPFSLLSAAFERAMHIALFVISQTPGRGWERVGTSA